jgi:hypothetical protein
MGPRHEVNTDLVRPGLRHEAMRVDEELENRIRFAFAKRGEADAGRRGSPCWPLTTPSRRATARILSHAGAINFTLGK